MTTRANIEAILVKRCGSMMSLVNMAVTTVGSNADLNDPIGYALRWGGYTVADISTVSDSDIDEIEDTDLDMVLDVAELRILQSVQGNYTLVDITNGPESEKFSQTAAVLKERIATLKSHVDEMYATDESFASFAVETTREDAYTQ